MKQRGEGGVARDTISQWARNYEADGMAAFMTRKDRVYSPELKRQAVEDYLSGMGSQAEICRKYHIRSRRVLHPGRNARRRGIRGEARYHRHPGA